MTQHLIAEVDFVGARQLGLPGEDALLRCTCGLEMQAGDYAAHRKEVGAKERSTQALGPAEPYNFNIKGPREAA